MKRVMIVDDEIFVRLGIKSVIDWEEYGYTVICEADNGQNALEKIEKYKPHIVFTDLRMDKMDGFELIEKGKKKYPNIQFVVLSNYNDYENVRKAMKLGAIDYIFKLTAKKEEIAAILQETADSEEQAKQEADSLLRKNYSEIKRRLIKTALQQNNWQQDRLLEEFASISVKTDFSRPCSALYLSIDNLYACRKSGSFPEISLLKFSVQNIVDEILEKNHLAETYDYDDGDFIILIHPNREENNQRFRENMESEMVLIKEYVKRYLGVSVSGTMSREFMGIDKLGKAVEQCREALKKRFTGEDQTLFLYNEPISFQAFQFPPDGGVKEWELLFREKAYDQMDDYLEKLWRFCREKGFCFSEPLQIGLMELYSVFRKYAIGSGCHFDELRDANQMSLYEAILYYDLLSSIADAFSAVLKRYREQYCGTAGVKGRSEIARVRQYVRQNLTQEISVPAAAKMANMSESYFAHLFKEETGMSFVNYVNRQRIEQAEVLLKQTDKKVGEIAATVGIDNPNYFSILFKKITGKTPNDFRS